MSSCELCGKQGSVSKVLVSGSHLSVCSQCTQYGTFAKQDSSKQSSFSAQSFTQRRISSEEVICDALSKIKSSCSKKGMLTKDFANAVGIKESLCTKILAGKLGLTVPLAKRIGNYLGLELVNKVTSKKNSPSHEDFIEDKKGGFTMADLIKKQMK